MLPHWHGLLEACPPVAEKFMMEKADFHGLWSLPLLHQGVSIAGANFLFRKFDLDLEGHHGGLRGVGGGHLQDAVPVEIAGLHLRLHFGIA